MPLVVIQTTVPDCNGHPFRITEVLERVADSADEAVEAAAVHVGGDREVVEPLLSARWHAKGGYWLVAYEPVPEMARGERVMVM
ncbi:MAG: hypothetical protein HY985_11550 [Magnetospirillum sp.]|nr:hypothetical protein [Magnetospirillum sp.]